ncbi:GNAT family N-acetyltransferase [Baekduia soli]|uniref:GNAT family N-acetyltransferase n=1 Tax=Baekduia soli TaxID=496014 RepID=A0A5B8U390_9ACTN|nr:GNAT family N-acetyltransferase [Baekduia soli]QEC47506.1 GNAT family N-acetyltransferase [Baekduia soli]
MIDPRLERALAFERAMHAATGRVITASWGQAFLDAALSRCYERNQVRTFADAGGLDAEALHREVDGVFRRAGLAHRQVCVQPPAVRRLGDPLARLGYERARHRFLAFTGAPPPPPRAAVVELDLATALTAQERYLTTDPDTPYGRDRRTREDLLEHHRTYGASAQERRFGILDAGGAGVAWAKLWTRDDAAQIEDVVCLQDHRGRGYGRDVVAAAALAALAADPGLLFIVADAEDWPIGLYRRLGFEDVGEVQIFTRLLPGAPGALA